MPPQRMAPQRSLQLLDPPSSSQRHRDRSSGEGTNQPQRQGSLPDQPQISTAPFSTSPQQGDDAHTDATDQISSSSSNESQDGSECSTSDSGDPEQQLYERLKRLYRKAHTQKRSDGLSNKIKRSIKRSIKDFIDETQRYEGVFDWLLDNLVVVNEWVHRQAVSRLARDTGNRGFVTQYVGLFMPQEYIIEPMYEARPEEIWLRNRATGERFRCDAGP